jgi:Ca-activated chloride channel homolog
MARITVDGRQNGRRVQWTTTANFPNRAPENSFVARLWASQRIGYLSAERHRNGGSPELDAEIRTLGERFSIPTELTSYFVREPNWQPVRRASMGGAVPAPAPVARRDVQFDAAKQAAEQRAVASTASMDAMNATAGGASTSERKVGGHAFRLESGVWTDVRPVGTNRVVTVKAYSKAYFDLLERLPELSTFAGLGEQITVVGRNVVISTRTDSGVESLGTTELERIVRDW